MYAAQRTASFSLVLGSGDQGDQLAAAAEEAVDHVAGHVVLVRADDGEVASDRRRARRPARTDRPSSSPASRRR